MQHTPAELLFDSTSFSSASTLAYTLPVSPELFAEQTQARVAFLKSSINLCTESLYKWQKMRPERVEQQSQYYSSMEAIFALAKLYQRNAQPAQTQAVQTQSTLDTEEIRRLQILELYSYGLDQLAQSVFFYNKN